MTSRVAEILSGVGVGPAGHLPHRLVKACTQALPVTGVGLVLMTNAGPAGTVAVTDGPAGTMEELQSRWAKGPASRAHGPGGRCCSRT